MTDIPRRGTPITDEELLDNYLRWLSYDKNAALTSRSYDPPIPERTMRDRIKQVFTRNIDGRYKEGLIAPGTEIVEEKIRLDKDQNPLFTTVRTRPQSSAPFGIPEDWAVSKSTVQLDADGNITQQWLRVNPHYDEFEQIVDAMRAVIPQLVDGFEPIQRAEPQATVSELLNVRPLPDLHLGMYAWAQETGTSWDLKLALAKYRDLMATLDLYSPAAETCVILGGGDMLHCDNKRNQTDRSGNPLDVDSRFSKVKEGAMMLLVFQIELARAKHKRVIVRILPGNHDELFADSAAWFLHAWYREVPEVEIDTDPGDFWFHQHGDVMLGANHGHKVKLVQLPRIMSTYKREMWGKTKWAYAHGFHLHHKEKVAWEEGGVVGEIHQTPVPPDAFHHGGGYADSQRTMCSITYHDQKGEQGRWTEPCF